MANWYGHSMTAVGQNLIAKVSSRELPLKFTSVKMGSGALGSRTVTALTALIESMFLIPYRRHFNQFPQRLLMDVRAVLLEGKSTQSVVELHTTMFLHLIQLLLHGNRKRQQHRTITPGLLHRLRLETRYTCLEILFLPVLPAVE